MVSPRFGRGLALWLTAFAASTVIGTHGIAYWDAGDYTLLAITGGKSGLLLGRPLFLWVSRLVLATGVSPADAEISLRWFWSAVGATAAPAIAVLASRIGLDRRSAFIAGASLALSPTFAHTSHQVLTDAPALALSIAALACAAANQPWRSGVLLAAAIATRETAAIHLAAIVLLLTDPESPGLKRQPTAALKALAACAITLGVVLAIDPPAGIGQWFGAMSRSTQAHPWSSRDFGVSLGWVLAAGPVPVIAGALGFLRRAGGRRLYLAAVPAVAGTVLLLFYPDGSFSPRYVLATVPLAFFLTAAPWLAKRPMIAAAALVIPLIAAIVPATRADDVAAYGATLTSRIPQLPENAVVVPGHFCPQARIASVIAKRPDIRLVCPGWDWPADVAADLDGALRQGRPVAVDVSSLAWVGTREDALRHLVLDWVGSHSTGEAPVAGFVVVLR